MRHGRRQAPRNGRYRTARRGPKQDGVMELVHLAERPSKPHAELPLHLFAGTPDRPDDAATLVMQENLHR